MKTTPRGRLAPGPLISGYLFQHGHLVGVRHGYRLPHQRANTAAPFQTSTRIDTGRLLVTGSVCA